MTEASSFHTEELKDWNSLQTYQRPSWIFRGHSDFDYRLQTSLERLCLGLGWKLNRAPYIEKAILREFKRHYHHFSTVAPDEKHDLEWFSIMQHHGAPTRLLEPQRASVMHWIDVLLILLHELGNAERKQLLVCQFASRAFAL